MLLNGFVINTAERHKASIVPNGESHKFCSPVQHHICFSHAPSLFLQILWKCSNTCTGFQQKWAYVWMVNKVFLTLNNSYNLGKCFVHSQAKFLSTKIVRHTEKLISSQDNKTYFERNAEHICFWHGHTFVFMLSVWVWH